MTGINNPQIVDYLQGGWQVAMYPNRRQPWTLWHAQRVWGFFDTREAAERYVESRPREKENQDA